MSQYLGVQTRKKSNAVAADARRAPLEYHESIFGLEWFMMSSRDCPNSCG